MLRFHLVWDEDRSGKTRYRVTQEQKTLGFLIPAPAPRLRWLPDRPLRQSFGLGKENFPFPMRFMQAKQFLRHLALQDADLQAITDFKARKLAIAGILDYLHEIHIRKLETKSQNSVYFRPVTETALSRDRNLDWEILHNGQTAGNLLMLPQNKQPKRVWQYCPKIKIRLGIAPDCEATFQLNPMKHLTRYMLTRDIFLDSGPDSEFDLYDLQHTALLEADRLRTW